MTPQELVIALVTAVFVDYDVEAARQLLAPDYIQHNPSIPTGADGLLNLIPIAKQTGLTVTTHRIITEGDIVVAHNTFENADAFGAPTLVSFDVFRIEDGILVEHWDNLQAPPAETASGRSMTDGAMGDVPTAFFDLWRLEDGMIVEHWDTIEPIPNEMVHENGKF